MTSTTKRAPLEAATSKSAKDNVQEQYTTTNQERQALFDAATALEVLGNQLHQTQHLFWLLCESLEEERRADLSQPRVEAYADALWVMLERLETIERSAYEKSDLVYQMHNKSK